MLKYVLMASAMTIAAPVLAQTTNMPQTTTGAPTTAAPKTSTSDPTTQAQPGSPAATPATPDATQATQATPAPGADAQTAAAQPAAQPGGVAGVVDSEWASYDTNGDGKLSETEFAAWMNKLKSASDTSFKPDAPATKAWNQAAFAQADKDKSKSVTKAELTKFLGAGQG